MPSPISIIGSEAVSPLAAMSLFAALVIVHALAATLALALHARLRLIPHLSDDTLAPLAWHIRGITALAVAFVVVGAGLRLGVGNARAIAVEYA